MVDFFKGSHMKRREMDFFYLEWSAAIDHSQGPKWKSKGLSVRNYMLELILLKLSYCASEIISGEYPHHHLFPALDKPGRRLQVALRIQNQMYDELT